jgi:hypothetical protein
MTTYFIKLYFRNLGPTEVVKWNELVAADLRKADDIVSKVMFTSIVKLFLEKDCMVGIPREFWPQFMKCATYIVVNEVMCEHFNILCSILPG